MRETIKLFKIHKINATVEEKRLFWEDETVRILNSFVLLVPFNQNYEKLTSTNKKLFLFQNSHAFRRLSFGENVKFVFVLDFIN